MESGSRGDMQAFTGVNRDWTERFNDTFASPASPAYARAWHEVFGDEYLPSLDTYSVSLTELRRIAKDVLIDESDASQISAAAAVGRRCG